MASSKFNVMRILHHHVYILAPPKCIYDVKTVTCMSICKALTVLQDILD